MSISSDIFITKAKAQKMVRSKLLEMQESLVEAVLANPKNTATKEELLLQQSLLVTLAVATMKCGELTSQLNDGSEDLYFYNISDNDDSPDEDDESEESTT